MRLSRSLCIQELEQRIAPAFTVTLDGGTTAFSFSDADGDTVAVSRDTGGVGTISVTDNDAVSLATFDNIDSIVFNAGCNATTTLAVAVTASWGSSNGIAQVGRIAFSVPSEIGALDIEGNVIGAAGVASITGTKIGSLIVRSASSIDGGISNPAVGGNVAAQAGQYGIVLSAGHAGSINIAGALTGGQESAISIFGNLTGTITVGDMTDKAISQFDTAPGANQNISGATISITGNSAQSLAGSLGAVWTDGSIINTTINVAKHLDPRSLSVADAISTDWDDNGYGTITDTTVNIGSPSSIGSLRGAITNNDGITGGFWPAAPGGNFQDMSVTVNVYGYFNGDVISGGSLSGTLWAYPTGPGGGDVGRFSALVMAFDSINDLTVQAYLIGPNVMFVADAEYAIQQWDTQMAGDGRFAGLSASVPFGVVATATPTGGRNVGEISNLNISSTSGLVATVSNNLFQSDYVGEDVDVALTAGSGMMLYVSSARDLNLTAASPAMRLSGAGASDHGYITAVRDADVSLDFGEMAFFDVTARRHLTLEANIAGGSNQFFFRPGILSDVAFRADTALSVIDPGNFVGNITCEGNLHDFHISGYDVTLALDVRANALTGATGDKGDFLSGDITALNDLKCDSGVGFSMNNFGATISAGNNIDFGPGQVFRASAAKFTYWDGDRFSGTWTISQGTVTADGDIDINFEFLATSTAGTLVLPGWYPNFRSHINDQGTPDPSDDVTVIDYPTGWDPVPSSTETLHSIQIKADNDLNGTGTLGGSFSSRLGLNSSSVLRGAEISADITISRQLGTLSDVNLYGSVIAGAGGISGNIAISGLKGAIISGGDVAGDVTINGNMSGYIAISGNSAGTIYITGNVANVTTPGLKEIEIGGDCNVLHIGGTIGPGSGPSDTVFITADNFDLLRIDGDVQNFVDILAGAEPGLGTIQNLVLNGFVVPEHITSTGLYIPQIRGDIINGAVPRPIFIGNETVNMELADSLGGGTLRIRVLRGSITFFYIESEDQPGKVGGLYGITVKGGTPSITMKASNKDADPVLRFLNAPAFTVTGADTQLFRNVWDLNLQNISVDEIAISGNARNINIKNGNLGNCTIGDPSHAQTSGIGYLNSLLLQGSASHGTGNITGDVAILHGLNYKMEAVNFTGSLFVGGSANTISVRRDLDAPINIAGSVRNITANRDLNGINQPITIGGDLTTFKAKTGPFTSFIQVLGTVRQKFDVRGGADSATRTITYDPFTDITTADYASGGVLEVAGRIPSGRIR